MYKLICKEWEKGLCSCCVLDRGGRWPVKADWTPAHVALSALLTSIACRVSRASELPFVGWG